MKAFRNIGGRVVEIDIDVDLTGNPILPPDTTTDKPPSIPEGHYSTVVGDRWVVIANPIQTVTFEMKQQEQLEKLKEYRAWLLEQPIEHDGRQFDGDETARARVSQALVSFQSLSVLPDGWFDLDNQLYEVPTYEDLCALALSIAGAFQSRFFETALIRTSIMESTTLEELELVECPGIPMDAMRF